MKQMTLTQAKDAFEDAFNAANAEPVLITSQGSTARVLLSLDDMGTLEDYLLGQAASRAAQGGYVGKAASVALTEKYLKTRADAGAPVPVRQDVRANTGRYDSEEFALAAVVEKLVAALDPREIWLFGSRATGRARPDSDFDLLIVAKPGGAFGSGDYEAVDKPLRGTGVGCDVVPCSAADFEEGLSLNTTLVTRVVNEGRLVYEAAST